MGKDRVEQEPEAAGAGTPDGAEAQRDTLGAQRGRPPKAGKRRLGCILWALVAFLVFASLAWFIHWSRK